ncbi:MAG: hypothetical protein KGL42_07905 [Betaproteobacteria bacterium]|nr:hypothetical protein [Betaproteobacteria bacterium]
MAELNRSAAGIVPSDSGVNANPLSERPSFDDLMRLLSDVKVWAQRKGMPELVRAMERAAQLSNTGWTEVHESLFALAMAKGHVEAGRQFDANRSIDVASKHLSRWNGRRMTLAKATIEAPAGNALLRGVSHA